MKFLILETEVIDNTSEDEDGSFHWMTTEGNSYENTVVSEFAAI